MELIFVVNVLMFFQILIHTMVNVIVKVMIGIVQEYVVEMLYLMNVVNVMEKELDMI